MLIVYIMKAAAVSIILLLESVCIKLHRKDPNCVYTFNIYWNLQESNLCLWQAGKCMGT